MLVCQQTLLVITPAYNITSLSGFITAGFKLWSSGNQLEINYLIGGHKDTNRSD